MIAEGALDGIDAIYGMHNWPYNNVGYCLAIKGPMMSEYTSIRVKLIK